jgi:hypothetical protein
MFKGSYWQGTVKDRQATQEVTQSNNAESGSAVVNKKLLPNCAELDAIKRHIARARLTHYQLTFDWMGELRCLPVSRLNDYMDKMDEEQREHDQIARDYDDAAMRDDGALMADAGRRADALRRAYAARVRGGDDRHVDSLPPRRRLLPLACCCW